MLLMAQDTGRVLLILRSPEVNEAGTWGLPGGALDDQADGGREKPHNGARREVLEEVGYAGSLANVRTIYVFESDGFRYHNLMAVVPNEFRPRLNWESSDAGWFDLEALPSPLHFGVRLMFAEVMDVIKDYRQQQKPVNELRSLLRAKIRTMT